MKRGVEVDVMGQKIYLKTDADEGLITEVVQCVTDRVQKAARMTQNSLDLKTALLACMNLAGEYVHFKKTHEDRQQKVKKKIEKLLGRFDVL